VKTMNSMAGSELPCQVAFQGELYQPELAYWSWRRSEPGPEVDSECDQSKKMKLKVEKSGEGLGAAPLASI
jgi:hypothetical protein